MGEESEIFGIMYRVGGWGGRVGWGGWGWVGVSLVEVCL